MKLHSEHMAGEKEGNKWVYGLIVSLRASPSAQTPTETPTETPTVLHPGHISGISTYENSDWSQHDNEDMRRRSLRPRPAGHVQVVPRKRHHRQTRLAAQLDLV